MVTKIRKWGNSLGLRIPKSFAQEAGVEEGADVDISVQGNRLVIERVHPAQYDLDDLLSEIREENLHDEVGAGEPVGREAL